MRHVVVELKDYSERSTVHEGFIYLFFSFCLFFLSFIKRQWGTWDCFPLLLYHHLHHYLLLFFFFSLLFLLFFSSSVIFFFLFFLLLLFTSLFYVFTSFLFSFSSLNSFPLLIYIFLFFFFLLLNFQLFFFSSFNLFLPHIFFLHQTHIPSSPLAFPSPCNALIVPSNNRSKRNWRA